MLVSKGIKLSHETGELRLDPHKRTDQTVFLSHAHSDHVRKHNGDILATTTTLNVSGLQGTPVEYNKPVNSNGFKIKLLNAGHVPGSSMAFVQDGETLLYTGDFRPRDSYFGRAKPVKCDKLIIESTYANPLSSFPDPETEYKEIQEWVGNSLYDGKSVLFGAYYLGKSQEVIRALNEVGIIPVVHPKTAEVSKKTGLNLSYYSTLSPEGSELLSKKFVAIVPPRMANPRTAQTLSRQSGTPVLTAIASGQPFYNPDKRFALSAHADYDDLMQFIETCSPEHVYVVHGNAKFLASEVTRQFGIKSSAL